MPGSLDVVSSSLLLPIVEQFRDAGAPVERLSERAGIKTHALQSPGSLLPRSAAQRFGVLASRYAGNGLLFYEASAQGIAPLVARAATPVLGRETGAFETLSRFFVMAAKATSAVRFIASVEGSRLWIKRLNRDAGSSENWQFEQYAVGSLETLAVSILGPRVRPIEIRLRSNPRADELPPQWDARQVSVHQDCTAVAFPASGLITAKPPSSGGDDFDSVPASDLGHAVLEYVKEPKTSIDSVAEAFGMTRRTFQRRLKEVGYTYSSLIEEAIFQGAIARLKGGGARITEVAMESGYSNPENFTRAFRRRYGLPPTQYVDLAQQQ